mmetsp:Transcript_56846/g.165009  ORF Transcript_56846/g.165009 Transcript_56846/m.165009 type:complete len:246 (+) Transcript_56846:851-1588(+)
MILQPSLHAARATVVPIPTHEDADPKGHGDAPEEDTRQLLAGGADRARRCPHLVPYTGVEDDEGKADGEDPSADAGGEHTWWRADTAQHPPSPQAKRQDQERHQGDRHCEPARVNPRHEHIGPHGVHLKVVVCMHLIHHPVRDNQLHLVISHGPQVLGQAERLDHDQHIRVDSKNLVPGPLGRSRPIRQWVAVPPSQVNAAIVVRLVADIEGHNVLVVLVTLRKCDQTFDPLALVVARGVPQALL